MDMVRGCGIHERSIRYQICNMQVKSIQIKIKSIGFKICKFYFFGGKFPSIALSGNGGLPVAAMPELQQHTVPSKKWDNNPNKMSAAGRAKRNQKIESKLFHLN
jgi:hypothetical protein